MRDCNSAIAFQEGYPNISKLNLKCIKVRFNLVGMVESSLSNSKWGVVSNDTTNDSNCRLLEHSLLKAFYEYLSKRFYLLACSRGEITINNYLPT